MKLVTRRDKILSIVKEWTDNFPEPTKLKSGGNSADILRKLKKLNLKKCSAKDVNDIIGNDTWLSLWCNICNKYIKEDFIIEVIESHSPGNGFCICEKCATKITILCQENG